MNRVTTRIVTALATLSLLVLLGQAEFTVCEVAMQGWRSESAW